MSEKNKQVVRRWVEQMCGQGKLEVAEEIFAAEVTDHNPIPNQQPGIEGQKQVLLELWAAFPDFHTEINDIIAEGDRVVLRWTGRGTHEGYFGDIGPTGRQIVYTGVDIVKIAGGKIVERWGISDDAGLLAQIASGQEAVSAKAETFVKEY
ncbi:MAG: ester cyclase [Chloroflexota bacterium]|nr:ester cyclase [Chloroflexota bacterium]MDQ5866224.1 ester cyclase [Chloroflexota bacterium]